MPYESIPHVGATFLDGSFRIITESNQPEILVLGSASGGIPLEKFRVGNVRRAEVEFGASSEIMQGVHEAVAQGADNVSVMRIGGKAGSVVITDSASATLTIQTELRDAQALERYALIIDGSGSENRILVYDKEDSVWVYDSEEILVIEGAVLPTVEVTDTGLGLFNLGSISAPDGAEPLSSLAPVDFTPVGAVTLSTVAATAGADGTSMSLPEYYANLALAYHYLDFRDADLVLVKGKGVYVDAANAADSGTPDYWKGVPVQGTSTDALGYAWQFVYQGELFVYMTDSSDYFSVAQAAATLVAPGGHDLTISADKAGAGGNNVTLQIDTTGAAGPTVTITEPAADSIAILVTDDGSSSTDATVTAIEAALSTTTLSTGTLAADLLTASGGSVQLLSVGGDLAATPLAGGTGGAYLNATELSDIPALYAVDTRFTAGADAELREVNFGHQLASFCSRASQTWKPMIGSISFGPPAGYSRSQVRSWVGELPTYTQIGLDLAIDAPADNGTGILGNKFLAGKSETSNGYRSSLVEEGDVTDGYAYGGFIATKGASLPNGDGSTPEDYAYGVADEDELLDENGAPVDLGKHLMVTYDFPIHRNSFNGGTTYRGSLAGTLLGKLAILPENEEPIGLNGTVLRVSSPPRVLYPQKNDLASVRAIGLRLEEGVGQILVSAKTAAHPDSDFIRSSTIRSVGRELTGVRDIAKKYIGKAFNPEQLASMQTEIDGFLQAERRLGFNQGAQAVISFTRSDRILGRLDIALRMVPPFAIDSIDVSISLAADESEL